MNPRNFIILAAVTLATVAGAVYALREQPLTRQALQPEEPVFPLLQERLNDAAKLEVVTAEGETVLSREAGVWTLPSKQGYPARENGVREVILDLRALKIAEPKTRKPEGFARLQVEDLEAEGAESRLIRVSADDGTVLAEALLGRQRPGALGDASGGVYYRVPGGEQAWLAAGTVELPEGERAWLQTDVVHVAANTVAALEVLHADGSRFTARRDDAETKAFEVTPIPEGRKAAASKTSKLGSALAFVSFAEVAPASEVDFVATPNRSTVTTFDGLAVTVELGEAEGELWAKVSAALAEDAPEDEAARAAAEERVAEINATTEGWAYRLDDHVVKRLLPKVEEHLEAEPEPAS